VFGWRLHLFIEPLRPNVQQRIKKEKLLLRSFIQPWLVRVRVTAVGALGPKRFIVVIRSGGGPDVRWANFSPNFAQIFWPLLNVSANISVACTPLRPGLGGLSRREAGLQNAKNVSTIGGRVFGWRLHPFVERLEKYPAKSSEMNHKRANRTFSEKSQVPECGAVGRPLAGLPPPMGWPRRRAAAIDGDRPLGGFAWEKQNITPTAAMWRRPGPVPGG